MTCNVTTTWHGDTLTCDVVGEHTTMQFGSDKDEIMHYSLWTNPEGVHTDDCPCTRSPECRGTVGPLEVRIGWSVDEVDA